MLQASKIRGNSVWPKSARQVSRDREGRRGRSSDAHAQFRRLTHGTAVKSNISPKYLKNTFSYEFLRGLKFPAIEFFGKICYTMDQRFCVIVV